MEQAKKECILVEAARAFSRFGFRKASIDQIAKRAGVAKGTVYLACESKQDLLYQVLHREVVSWIGEVAKAVDPRVPADELLLAASDAGLAYIDQRPLLKALLFGEAHAWLPAWEEKLDALVVLGRHNVEQILRLGIEQGRFNPKIDIPEVAQLLLDLQLAFFVFHDRGPNRQARIRRRRAAAFDLVLHGLQAH